MEQYWLTMQRHPFSLGRQTQTPAPFPNRLAVARHTQRFPADYARNISHMSILIRVRNPRSVSMSGVESRIRYQPELSAFLEGFSGGPFPRRPSLKNAEFGIENNRHRPS
jgi:hypothetical protein